MVITINFDLTRIACRRIERQGLAAKPPTKNKFHKLAVHITPVGLWQFLSVFRSEVSTI